MSTTNIKENHKIKIAYCIPSCYNSGGMERVLSLKANYLANVLNYNVYIITTGQKNNQPFWHLSTKITLIDLSIDYDELEKTNLFRKLTSGIYKRHKHKKKLKELLCQLKAEIVVSMFTHELPFLYKIKDGSKKILELHFSKKFRTLHNRYNHANLVTKILGQYLNYRDCKAAKRYEKFIVLTNEDKDSWKDFKNIEVIPNPLSFSPTNLSNNRTKSLIAVGRLCPQKGFDLLINIWTLINPKLRESWKLYIYGSGPDKEKLQNQIEKRGLKNEIQICPPTKNILDIYSNASIFCFTSQYEGFGMALIEAMASGMACVSFNCPCGPSDIIEQGKNGFLIEASDCHKFAHYITELMRHEELRKLIGKNASVTAKEKYNIDTIMAQWVNLFNDLLK